MSDNTSMSSSEQIVALVEALARNVDLLKQYIGEVKPTIPKPCPFCGCKSILTSTDGGAIYYFCRDCACRTSSYTYDYRDTISRKRAVQNALAVWNRRPKA